MSELEERSDVLTVNETEVIADEVRFEILRRIRAAEHEHNVKVLFAVESGSRAWGFSSPNSDYDVRFVYVRKCDWYMSLDVEDKRDVIEYPIVDEIDINGWDLRKALKLFWKSNPTFIEWIQSSIVYVDDQHFSKSVCELMPSVVASHKGIYHYLHMAKRNYREYLKGVKVPLKKYFYVLRPLLAIRWLEQYDSPAPIEFEKLRVLITDDVELNNAIENLLARKRQSLEKELIDTVPAINAFIEKELDRHADFSAPKRDKAADFEMLNQLFREVVTKYE